MNLANKISEEIIQELENGTKNFEGEVYKILQKHLIEIHRLTASIRDSLLTGEEFEDHAVKQAREITNKIGF